MNWPNDADGDVFRRLAEHGFNFEAISTVDFDIDFDHWPLTLAEQERVITLYPNCEFYDPDEEDLEEGNTIGYVQCRFNEKLTYEFIMHTQEKISDDMRSIGGWCDSWGVLC